MTLEGRPLLGSRGHDHRHPVTPHDLRHFLAVGRAAGGGIDDLGCFAEICGAHDCGGYDDKLFRILAAKVVEAVRRAPWDAQCLPGTNLNGRAINRPSEDALDTVEGLLVGVVLVGWRRQLLSGGDEQLENGHAAVGIAAREKEPDPEWSNPDGLFRRIDPGTVLLRKSPLAEIPVYRIFRHESSHRRLSVGCRQRIKWLFNIR